MMIVFPVLAVVLFPFAVITSPVMFPVLLTMYMSTCNDAVPATIHSVRRIDDMMCEITVLVSDVDDDGKKHTSCRGLAAHTFGRRPVPLPEILCSVMSGRWVEGAEVTLLHNHVFHDGTCKRLATTAADTQNAVAWYDDRIVVLYFGFAFAVLAAPFAYVTLCRAIVKTLTASGSALHTRLTTTMQNRDIAPTRA
jgi:hypothetical protein